jgi:PleD family two-component response regulator
MKNSLSLLQIIGRFDPFKVAVGLPIKSQFPFETNMSQAPQFNHPVCAAHKPNALMEETHCTLHEEPAIAIEPSESSSVKILVVEDNRSSADILCLFFKMEGHDAVCAYCGQDALLSIESKPPEIIFLDLGLPDISGY